MTYRVKRKQDPSLTKIIIGILVVGGAALGLVRFSQWFSSDYIAGQVEASAEINLAKAERFAQEGNTLEAKELLRPILARVEDPLFASKAHILQAGMDRDAGDIESALEHLRAATEDFPNSPEQPIAAITYAHLLEESAKFSEALAVYQSVRETAPPALRAPALSGLAREQERHEDLTQARLLYQQAFDESPWHSESWEEAAQGLGRLNVQSIFDVAPNKESKIYRVAKGDTLTSIGSKLNTTQGLLMRANGIENANRLRPNQSLKYTPKDFSVVIERSTCKLYLFDSEGLFKVYSTGLGKSGQDTTLGKYKIGNKEKNPTWHKPGTGPIPPGDPRNELGTRWLPLVPEEEDLPTDLGIHGTISPETVGKYTSMGCPRMFKEDVEEFYDLIVRSTPVTIVETYSPTLDL